MFFFIKNGFIFLLQICEYLVKALYMPWLNAKCSKVSYSSLFPTPYGNITHKDIFVIHLGGDKINVQNTQPIGCQKRISQDKGSFNTQLSNNWNNFQDSMSKHKYFLILQNIFYFLSKYFVVWFIYFFFGVWKFQHFYK
jgi:hypothetical protein